MNPIPEPRLPSTFIWLVCGLIALHACMAATRVVASLWVLHKGHDEFMVGIVISLFAVAPILLSIWAGRLADRHGLQRPVRLAVAMGLAGTAASASAPSLWTVGAACFLTGGALSLAAVAIQREAGQLAHAGHDLKRIFSWVALGPALSNVLAPLASGLIIDHAGMQAAFAACVLLPLAAFALLSRVGSGFDTGFAPGPRVGIAGPAWELLRLAPLRVLLLLNLALAAAWDAHTFAVPVVGHLREMSASQIGVVFASFAAAATTVRLLIVGWASRISEPVMLRGAMALASGVLLVYVWMPGLGGLMIASALLGLALGSVQPMVLSMLHQVTPSDRQGQALGLRMMVTNAATVGMPMLFGLMSVWLSTAAPMWLMAGLLLLAQWPALSLAAWARPQGRASGPGQPPGPP